MCSAQLTWANGATTPNFWRRACHCYLHPAKLNGSLSSACWWPSAAQLRDAETALGRPSCANALHYGGASAARSAAHSPPHVGVAPPQSAAVPLPSGRTTYGSSALEVSRSPMGPRHGRAAHQPCAASTILSPQDPQALCHRASCAAATSQENQPNQLRAQRNL